MRFLLLPATLLFAACATSPDRPARASYDCMAAVRAGLPDGLPDKRAHCIVSARIARRCSVFEAYVAGIGKEFTDAFDGGDPEWSDWQADRAGVRCAKQNNDDDAIVSCCAERGY